MRFKRLYMEAQRDVRLRNIAEHSKPCTEKHKLTYIHRQTHTYKHTHTYTHTHLHTTHTLAHTNRTVSTYCFYPAPKNDIMWCFSCFGLLLWSTLSSWYNLQQLLWEQQLIVLKLLFPSPIVSSPLALSHLSSGLRYCLLCFYG